jgi:eukaryotic-like serine/threonine-protein kinase
MKLLAPGTEIDGFVIDECIHAGGMAHIYRVRYAQAGRDPGFALAMKVPRMTGGDGAETIVGFEVEH